jgi:hypothetical protein
MYSALVKGPESLCFNGKLLPSRLATETRPRNLVQGATPLTCNQEVSRVILCRGSEYYEIFLSFFLKILG